MCRRPSQAQPTPLSSSWPLSQPSPRGLDHSVMRHGVGTAGAGAAPAGAASAGAQQPLRQLEPPDVKLQALQYIRRVAMPNTDR